jgi:manganese/iron transport system substrate-binding protein
MVLDRGGFFRKANHFFSRRWQVGRILTLFYLTLVILSACGGGGKPTEGGKLRVLATTTIVGDVVKQVGGSLIDLEILLPAGVDPHTFSPSPQDVTKISEADIIFANGAGLEVFLEPMIESAGAKSQVVSVSDGITLRRLTGQDSEDDDQHSIDPHTWTDPNNVKIWVQNIATALSEADGSHSSNYWENARIYQAELDVLDAWIRDQVAEIPEDQRVIVSDHITFGYFADRYGFDLAGAIVPGFSSLAEPSAQDLAQLEEVISSLSIKAIFVGTTVNPTLAERVSQDTGAKIVFLYTGSLTEAGGDADNYIEYMKYDTQLIVDALK